MREEERKGEKQSKGGRAAKVWREREREIEKRRERKEHEVLGMRAGKRDGN